MWCSKAISKRLKIVFSGDMLSFTNSLWTNFELVEHSETDEKLKRARIKLLNDATVNDLLKTVLPVAQVHSLNEVIPSMNDIFIRVVQQKEASDE